MPLTVAVSDLVLTFNPCSVRTIPESSVNKVVVGKSTDVVAETKSVFAVIAPQTQTKTADNRSALILPFFIFYPPF